MSVEQVDFDGLEPEDHTGLVHPDLGEPSEIYDYHDGAGNLVFVVARFDPKDFRQAHRNGDFWAWNLAGVRRVLYRLPLVERALAAGEPVTIAEGERDVLALEQAGVTATCNPMGAAKWTDELSEQLGGARRVRIVVDRDEDASRGVDGLTPGERHARIIVESLGRVAGVASSDIELVQAAEGKDAADHLAAGRTLDEFEPFELPLGRDVEAGLAWRPIDLTAAEYAQPSEPPALCGLIYAGKRHAISGPPEAAKTICSLIFALEHLRAGGLRFAHIDFEMGAAATRRLLDDLGASPEEIRACWYVEPDGPPTVADVEQMLTEGVTFAIIDAAAGAYDASGLDDNKRVDAEKFARAWIRPLWKAGVTTLLIDHVTKASETRGKYAIGSERKLGQVEVHLGLEAITPLHRGGDGLFRVSTHKDRPGHLPRPRAADVNLRSSADGRISYTIQPAEPSSSEHSGFRPTELMKKVVAYLREQDGPVPRSTIEAAVSGKAQYLRLAIDILAAEGAIIERSGNRNTRLYELPQSPARPELVPGDTAQLVPSSSQELPLDQAETGSSSQLVPSSSRVPASTSSPRPSPLQGEDEDGDELNQDELNRLEAPLLGDPGYPMLLDRAYTAGHLTADELRRTLTLNALVARSRQAAT